MQNYAQLEIAKTKDALCRNTIFSHLLAKLSSQKTAKWPLRLRVRLPPVITSLTIQR